MGDDSADSEGKRPRIRNPQLKNGYPNVGFAPPNEDKKLLEQYKALRSEIRIRIQVANKRGTQGLLVLGGIIATAVAQKNFYVLAFVPLVAGLFLTNAIISRNEILTIANHLCDIEEKLSRKNSVFRYEKKHGAGFGTERSDLLLNFDSRAAILGISTDTIRNASIPSKSGIRSKVSDLSISNYESWPNHARILMYGVAYTSFGILLVRYWEKPHKIFPEPEGYSPKAELPSLFGHAINEEMIASLFLLLTLILALVIMSHLLYRKKLKNKREGV